MDTLRASVERPNLTICNQSLKSAPAARKPGRQADFLMDFNSKTKAIVKPPLHISNIFSVLISGCNLNPTYQPSITDFLQTIWSRVLTQ